MHILLLRALNAICLRGYNCLAHSVIIWHDDHMIRLPSRWLLADVTFTGSRQAHNLVEFGRLPCISRPSHSQQLWRQVFQLPVPDCGTIFHLDSVSQNSPLRCFTETWGVAVWLQCVSDFSFVNALYFSSFSFYFFCFLSLFVCAHVWCSY